MDGNLWGGPEVVKNDPNHINNNGKLFKDFLRNNPQLSVGNNLDICEGSYSDLDDRCDKMIKILEVISR